MLAGLTLVLGVFAAQIETSAELTSFAPESEAAVAFDRVQQDFAGESLNVLFIAQAPGGGSILTPEALAAASRVESAMAEVLATASADHGTDPAAADHMPPSSPSGAADGPAVISFAQPFLAAGFDPSTADEAAIAETVRAVAAEQPQSVQLLSRDFSAERAEASAGLIVAPLGLQISVAAGGTTATEEELQEAIELSNAVVAAAEGAAGGVLTLLPFNEVLLVDELEGGITDELPLLLGASLTLVLVILIFTFRSISDVVIGIAGLLMAVIWTLGLSALLGPGYLGLLGPFSQMATAVPVLIVGLGIDYSIHLAGRYREEAARGRSPQAAATRSMVTVGAALVLATLTVVVGFLTNLVSPLPPLRDFAVFVSVGVLAAFLIFILGVPAARQLLDRRPGRRPVSMEARNGRIRSSGFSGLMARASVLSEHRPGIVIVVSLAITVAAGAAATQVSTTFQITDFIPENSRAGQALQSLERHFGGDLTERTYIVVDGGLTDPEVLNALLEVESGLTGTPHVQEAGGRVPSTSPATLIAQAAAARPDVAGELGWSGDALAPTADVDGLYALVEEVMPGQLAAVLSADRTAGVVAVPSVASQEHARDLAEALRGQVAPIERVGSSAAVTSQDLVLEEALDALTESQAQGIVITLVGSLALLVAYFTLTSRRPLLGLATMLPSLLVTVWTLGTMWALGLSFNVLTVMVSALAIGIGVPYGVHVANRFIEELDRRRSVDEAIARTMAGTGGALAGSAATTAAGFGVLMLSSLAPLQQFGLIVALVIVYSLIAAVLVEPSVLKYWAKYRRPEVEP